MGTDRQKIILVDDNVANLTIGRNLLKSNYEVYPVPSAKKLFEILENIVIPELILLDIDMPVTNGFEAISKLKGDKRFADIPVIFLTAKSDETSELMGFDLGAVDYISKPFSAPLLMKRIENQLLILKQKATIQDHVNNLSALVNRKTKEVFDLQNSVLNTVADLVEFRDKLTGGHISRTQLYLKALFEEIIKKRIYSEEVSQWDLAFFLPSAQLHDVGKIAISDLILNKPTKLTSDEFEIMKTHVTVGVDAIRKIMDNTAEHAFLRHALNIVGAHHEKWDGSGYPKGLKDDEIPFEGRLMAIADVYDSLISARPYKKPLCHEDAKKIIENGAGTHFDPALVGVFNNVSDVFAQVANDHIDGELDTLH